MAEWHAGDRVRRIGEDTSWLGWTPGIVTSRMAMKGWPVVKWPNVCHEEMGVDPATIELVEKHWGAPPGVTMVAIAPDEIASLRLLFDLIEDGDWGIETYGGGFDGGNQTEPAECCATLPNGEMIAWDQQSSRRYRASELAALVAAVNFTRKMLAEARGEVSHG